MALPPDLEARAMDAADLDPVIELIGRCDRTYLEWAPAGWEPPDLGWYRERWQRRLRNRNHWARGAFDRERRLRAVVAWLPDADRTGRVQPGVAQLRGAVSREGERCEEPSPGDHHGRWARLGSNQST